MKANQIKLLKEIDIQNTRLKEVCTYVCTYIHLSPSECLVPLGTDQDCRTAESVELRDSGSGKNGRAGAENQ